MGRDEVAREERGLDLRRRLGEAADGLARGPVDEGLREGPLRRAVVEGERVARREEEMSSLKKALCIFENFEAG